MGSMRTQRRQILWFLAIYGLSLVTFVLLAMLARIVLRWTS
jgi:hypothetical protein